MSAGAFPVWAYDVLQRSGPEPQRRCQRQIFVVRRQQNACFIAPPSEPTEAFSDLSQHLACGPNICSARVIQGIGDRLLDGSTCRACVNGALRFQEQLDAPSVSRIAPTFEPSLRTQPLKNAGDGAGMEAYDVCELAR